MDKDMLYFNKLQSFIVIAFFIFYVSCKNPESHLESKKNTSLPMLKASYLAQCDQKFDFSKLPNFKCEDFPLANRFHYNHALSSIEKAAQMPDARCLNPEVVNNRENSCSSGEVRTGQMTYTRQGREVSVSVTCDLGEMNFYQMSFILFDPENKNACFFSVGPMAAYEPISQSSIRKANFDLFQGNNNMSCTYCHRPHLITKPPITMTHILETYFHNTPKPSTALPLIPAQSRKVPYNIVGADVLNQISKIEIKTYNIPKEKHRYIYWDSRQIKEEENPYPNLKFCHKCHNLSNSHYHTRLALVLFNICEDKKDRNFKPCRGLQYDAISKALNAPHLHNFFFTKNNSELANVNLFRDDLIQFYKDCSSTNPAINPNFVNCPSPTN